MKTGMASWLARCRLRISSTGYCTPLSSAPSRTRSADGLRRRVRGRFVGEADDGGEPPPDGLRHEKRDVDARVRQGATDARAEARAVVPFHEETREIERPEP